MIRMENIGKFTDWLKLYKDEAYKNRLMDHGLLELALQHMQNSAGTHEELMAMCEATMVINKQAFDQTLLMAAETAQTANDWLYIWKQSRHNDADLCKKASRKLATFLAT